MTAPRQVLRGTTYFVSRRTLHGRFMLRPGKLTNQLFLYILAVASTRHGVKVHAYCAMSNHYHLLVTDPHARLPAFEQLLDALLGRALNALYGQAHYFWDSDGYVSQCMEAPSDFVDKAAYTLANPVAAGLVRKARKWPGAWSAPEAFGTSIEIARPAHFFSENGAMEETVTLELTVPPGFASVEEWRTEVAAALEAKEVEARRVRKGFLGVARVLKQRVLAQAKLPRPRGSLKPKVAAKDPVLRIALLCRLEAFVAAHREALLEWRRGRREVVFPEGTYQMRVAHCAACAGAG